MIVCGLGSTVFLFWLLFKKDAPSYEEVKENFLTE